VVCSDKIRSDPFRINAPRELFGRFLNSFSKKILFSSLELARSLMHRYLIPLFPILRLMGSVAGERDTGLSLLNSGFWVGVIPGTNCNVNRAHLIV